MNKFHYVTSKLFGFLESVAGRSNEESRFKATFFLFYSTANPKTAFSKIPSFKLLNSGEVSHCHFKAIRSKKSEDLLPAGDFYLAQTSEKNIWMLVCTEEADFINKRIKSFFSYWKCPFTQSFLATDEIKQVLDSISSTISGCEIESTKYVAYSRDQHKATIQFDVFEYKNLISAIEDRDAYLSKINFVTYNKGVEILKAGIERDFTLAYYHGDIHSFYSICLSKAARLLAKNMLVLSDKTRVNYVDRVKPIEILYDEEVFKDISSGRLLVEAFSELKRTNFTVFHSNPYFHGSVVDFKDGATFDVYITSSKSLSIIPRFKASPAALSRIINRIFETIKEGTVETEQSCENYSLDDLFSERI